MITTNSPIYRKAFAQYLRHGTFIEMFIKVAADVEHPTPYYIWRTVGDDKVRPSHASNNGKVFAWDNPPETGNPGEDYNCRCWAEPFYGVSDSGADVLLLLIPFLRTLRISRIAITAAEKLVRRTTTHVSKYEGMTEHAAAQALKRGISSKEVKEAVSSAKKTGNVSVQRGKYGTPQIHYQGSNGVTVIEETSGRNAGKIITVWRN